MLKGNIGCDPSIALTSDCRCIIVGDESNVKIWNLKDKTRETFSQGHLNSVSSIGITRDSKYIVSGGTDKTVRIWNLQRKTQEAVLLGHTSSVTSLAITSDNKYIVSGGHGDAVRIWNLQGKIQEPVLEGHDTTAKSNLKYREI